MRDISNGDEILQRATVIQRKTGRPVQFEITIQTRNVLNAWKTKQLSTRQYARLVKRWATAIGLDPTNYGTHSLRRTKPTLIYRNTRNLRAVQLLLGHTRLESTVRYLGVDLEDALTLSEQTEI